MLTYVFDRKGKAPLYEQLYDCIRRDITSGRLRCGAKLPSKRTLAEHLGVSKVTVEAAYAQLAAEGYIYSVEKKGYYAEQACARPYCPVNSRKCPGAGEAAIYRRYPFKRRRSRFFPDIRVGEADA